MQKNSSHHAYYPLCCASNKPSCLKTFQVAFGAKAWTSLVDHIHLFLLKTHVKNSAFYLLGYYLIASRGALCAPKTYIESFPKVAK